MTKEYEEFNEKVEEYVGKRIRNIKDNGIYRVYGNGEFLGLGELIDTDLLVKRVYNNV